MDADFRAKLWLYEAATSPGAWHFATVPRALSAQIRAHTAAGHQTAFGTLAVHASIGRTRWKTSIFWDSRRQSYLLPVKAEVRRREQLREGDAVDVSLVVTC